MEKVQNFNAYKKCNEKYCDEDYTHFENICINGFDISLPLCERHAKEWDERFSTVAKEIHDKKMKVLERTGGFGNA